MKIDRGLYLYHRKISLNEEYVRLISSTERFSNLTPELTEYIKKIPERIYLQQEIYQNNTEKNMYESMLKNKNTIERTDENGKKIQVTVGNEFAIWLDEIVAWNQEKYFLEQIEAGNTTGFEWSL
mgnify:CR=1 FL=1